MSIKTILVPVLNLLQARSAIETAFLVARRFNGHVVGLHVRPAFDKERAEVKGETIVRRAGDQWTEPKGVSMSVHNTGNVPYVDKTFEIFYD